jgi:hypothetical protein
LRVLESIPADHQTDREILESRLAAARWGGEPGQAKSAARLLADRWPDDPGVQRVRRELFLDYGIAMQPSFRFASDSDGFSERLFEQEFVLHAGAANRLQFGVGERQFSQDQNLGWRRYEVSWSGNLSRSWSAYASAAGLQYTSGPPRQQFLGDMALTMRPATGSGSPRAAAPWRWMRSTPWKIA